MSQDLYQNLVPEYFSCVQAGLFGFCTLRPAFPRAAPLQHDNVTVCKLALSTGSAMSFQTSFVHSRVTAATEPQSTAHRAALLSQSLIRQGRQVALPALMSPYVVPGGWNGVERTWVRFDMHTGFSDLGRLRAPRLSPAW